jgi:hypothetical protein
MLMLTSIPIVGAVEHTTIKDQNRIAILNAITDKFIEEYGIEAHIAVYNNVVTSIYPKVCNSVHFGYDENGQVYIKNIESNKEVNYYDWFSILILICVAIAEFCVLLFGHGEVGMTIAYFTCAVLMFIPCRIGSLFMIWETFVVGGLAQVIMQFLENLSINPALDTLREIIYEYGILGGLVVIMIASPVLIILLPLILFAIILAPFIVIPFIRIAYTLELIETVLGNVFYNVRRVI